MLWNICGALRLLPAGGYIRPGTFISRRKRRSTRSWTAALSAQASLSRDGTRSSSARVAASTAWGRRKRNTDVLPRHAHHRKDITRLWNSVRAEKHRFRRRTSGRGRERVFPTTDGLRSSCRDEKNRWRRSPRCSDGEAEYARLPIYPKSH